MISVSQSPLVVNHSRPVTEETSASGATRQETISSDSLSNAARTLPFFSAGNELLQRSAALFGPSPAVRNDSDSFWSNPLSWGGSALSLVGGSLILGMASDRPGKFLSSLEESLRNLMGMSLAGMYDSKEGREPQSNLEDPVIPEEGITSAPDQISTGTEGSRRANERSFNFGPTLLELSPAEFVLAMEELRWWDSAPRPVFLMNEPDQKVIEICGPLVSGLSDLNSEEQISFLAQAREAWQAMTAKEQEGFDPIEETEGHSTVNSRFINFLRYRIEERGIAQPTTVQDEESSDEEIDETDGAGRIK